VPPRGRQEALQTLAWGKVGTGSRSGADSSHLAASNGGKAPFNGASAAALPAAGRRQAIRTCAARYSPTLSQARSTPCVTGISPLFPAIPGKPRALPPKLAPYTR
jgi:hypothetical protein